MGTESGDSPGAAPAQVADETGSMADAAAGDETTAPANMNASMSAGNKPLAATRETANRRNLSRNRIVAV